MTPDLKSQLYGLVPAAVRGAALLETGGFNVYEGVLDHRTLSLLANEAYTLYDNAEFHQVLGPDTEEIRGGEPQRKLRSTPGGPIQDALYQSSWLSEVLSDVTGIPVSPTGKRGTYSYYTCSGDHLSLHRDVVKCDIALISALHVTESRDEDAGALCLYPDRVFEPLSSIRQNPKKGRLTLKLCLGESLVMYGGIVPHQLLPVAKGQERIVSILCYQRQ